MKSSQPVPYFVLILFLSDKYNIFFPPLLSSDNDNNLRAINRKFFSFPG